MSTVNYSLKHKGVRLIDASEAWVKGKNGKLRLNPKYSFVGKIETIMPNMIVAASDKKKPCKKVERNRKGSECTKEKAGKSTFSDEI